MVERIADALNVNMGDLFEEATHVA